MGGLIYEAIDGGTYGGGSQISVIVKAHNGDETLSLACRIRGCDRRAQSAALRKCAAGLERKVKDQWGIVDEIDVNALWSSLNPPAIESETGNNG